MEEFYLQRGFQHVRTLPPVIGKQVEEIRAQHPDIQATTMVYIFADHPENDSSLSSRPDLLVIDGGKGQLSTVVEVLKQFELSIPVIGLAKREEEVFVPGASVSILFSKDSQAKFLLMRLRDEAHRFANRHRTKRAAKTLVSSALDSIPSIGPETRQKLLQEFGSVDAIRKAPDDVLQKILSEEQIRGVREIL